MEEKNIEMNDAESQNEVLEIPKSKRLQLRINLGVAGFWISLATLICTPVIYILDQVKDYKRTQYTNQPYYEVVKVEPHYILKMESNPFGPTDSIGMTSNGLHEMPVSISVAIKYFLENTGASKARSWFQMFRDTFSGEQVLNEFIQTNNQTEKYVNAPSPFFSHKIVNVRDTFSIVDTMTIESIADSMFAVHGIFIYENDYKQLYYSYYTALFEFNPFDLLTDFDTIRKEPYIKIAKKDLENAVTLVEDNCTPHAYSRKERRRVLNFIRSRGWTPPD